MGCGSSIEVNAKKVAPASPPEPAKAAAAAPSASEKAGARTVPDTAAPASSSDGAASAAPPSAPAPAAAAAPAPAAIDYDKTQKSMDQRMQEGSLTRRRRAGVSAETTKTAIKGKRSSSVDKAIGAQPVISPKSDETKTMLKAAIDKCLLFDTMTEAQRNVVIDVMVAVNVAKGDAVIKQGDELSGGSGDNFYVVGEGTFDIHRVREGETTPELVQQRAAGDIFGELALMYNVPRQATVTCTSDGALLWALRRQTFQEIQHSQALDSIHTLNETLQAIEMLSTLDENQFSKLVNAFEVVHVAAKTRVITQGELGDAFYVILQGQVECRSESSPAVLMTLNGGEYFGERALLKDDPRAVHVDCVDDCVLAKLTRSVFTEVLGPLQQLMETELTRRILRSVPLLSHLTDGERDQVLEKFIEYTYEPGESILKQGETGDQFFLVKEGTVECFVKVPNSKELKLVKVLGTGEYFGERALLKDEPRAADVLARTRVSVVALRREDFTNLLGPLQAVLDDNMLKDTLRTVPILKSLSAAERESILECFQFTEFKFKDVLFKQGDTGYSFVLIREGTVDCVKDGVVVATQGSGSYVGERSLLHNEPRACDVVVTSEGGAKVAYLEKEDFEKSMGPISEVLKRSADSVKKDDLEEFAILGTGTFGKVKLVKHRPSGQTFAMKIISKQKVIQYNQQVGVICRRSACPPRPRPLTPHPLRPSRST